MPGVLVTGRVWEHDPETRRLLFDVNTLGTINGTLAALEEADRGGPGSLTEATIDAAAGAN